MMQDLEIRSARRDKGVFVASVWQKAHRDPSPRFSDDGARVYDREIGAWVAAGKPIDKYGQMVGTDAEPGPSAIPRLDGSGVWWEARFGQQLLWRIEARLWSDVLNEKRRLCELRGLRAKLVWLRQIPSR
ncbi:MAG: hypothetical protein ACREEW_14395 [Caulobacteraceae bacterium]